MKESRSNSNKEPIYIGILAILFCVMTVWTWRKWPDVLIDFGREVYLPWQISSGSVLYRDINHLFGPASVYFNALLFYMFGASCTVIFASNLILLLVLLCIIYCYIKSICDALTAFTCCLVTITAFSFSQQTILGSCNFIAPYSHEATHGVILSFIIMYVLTANIFSRYAVNIIIGGMLSGITLLMKTEISLSIIIASIIYLLMKPHVLSGECIKSSKYSYVAIYCLSIIVFPMLFVLYFMNYMTMLESVRAIAEAWENLLNSDITGSYYYRYYLGTSDLLSGIARMVAGTTISLLIIVICVYKYNAEQANNDKIRYICGLVLSIYILLSSEDYLNYSVPLLIFVTICWLITVYVNASDSEYRFKLLSYIYIASFALILSGKMLFRFTFTDTGFYLALPATLVLIAITTYSIPQWLEQRSRNGASFRNTAVIVIFVSAIHSIDTCNGYYKHKNYSIGSGANTIITYEPEFDKAAIPISRTLKYITGNLRDGESFAVLPEGVIFNFLTEHPNITHNINFMPPELSAFGEENIVSSFISHPPDYILIVHKDTSYYGVGYFGMDPQYGMKIMAWVESNYMPVALFGDEPLVGEQFGIKILKKQSKQI